MPTRVLEATRALDWQAPSFPVDANHPIQLRAYTTKSAHNEIRQIKTGLSPVRQIEIRPRAVIDKVLSLELGQPSHAHAHTN
jgi:hypothetical protein